MKMSKWSREEGALFIYLHNVISVGEHAADDSKEDDHDTEEAQETGPCQSGDVFVQAQRRYDEDGHKEDDPEPHDTHRIAPGRHNPHHNFAQSVAHDHVVGNHRWNWWPSG